MGGVYGKLPRLSFNLTVERFVTPTQIVEPNGYAGRGLVRWHPICITEPGKGLNVTSMSKDDAIMAHFVITRDLSVLGSSIQDPNHEPEPEPDA